MDRTPQHIYASNLLRRQSFGYPLRNPRPKDKSDSEGLQIGDVGYVNKHGEFIPVFNIHSPPKELEHPPLNFPLSRPVAKRVFEADRVLMSGVKQDLRREESGPRVDYAFTTTEREGAILILPDGAILSELEDTELEKIREHAAGCALEWCRHAKKDSLYLLTAVYKSKSWTLGSFCDASKKSEILVTRPCDSAGISIYKWKYQSNVDDQQGPKDNFYFNQTVLVQGFKMTMRKGWLPWSEWSEWWFARILAKLCLVVSQQWLTRITIDYFPSLNLSQPHHPLDIVNRVLLDENPRARVAVTHDNDWVDMLGMGLSPEYLTQEEQLQEFVVKKHLGKFDSNHQTVRLRNILHESGVKRDPEQDPSSHSRNDCPRLVITNMRLENLDIGHIYAGVCVLIQFGSTKRGTTNKPHAPIIEWDDEIILPSDALFRVAICGVFQLGSTLGTREISTKQTIDIKDLSGPTHIVEFSAGKTKSCASLLITLGRHFSHFETLSSHEEKSNFAEKTNSGFDALYSYHDVPKEEDLQCALGSFESALDCCGLHPARRANALCNLATAKFIRCQTHGTYSEVNEPIKLYEEALELRDSGNPDRQVTLLLLSQALLSRYWQEYDESIATRIGYLLAEILPDDIRNRRTADAILRTCRLYQAVNARDPTEVNNSLFGDLDPGIYSPPYGYFDRPHVLHKLAVAAWARFQLYANIVDLDRSIALSEEALYLIPDGHDGQLSIAACLGRSHLRRFEVHGELTDVDMLVDLVDLGERVATTLDKMLIEGVIVSAEGKDLHEQIALISAADTVVQWIKQEVPSPRIPGFQSIIDEWSREDGVPTRCRGQLGMLLSFLGGIGETKMRALLRRVNWPEFKKYKIEETTQLVQNYMSYFWNIFAAKFGVTMTSAVSLRDSVDDALAAPTKFKLMQVCILRTTCDALCGNDYFKEAIACFQRLKNKLAEDEDASFHEQQVHWELDFQRRYIERLEQLGDVEMNSGNYNEAAEHFSTILSRSQEIPVDILIKRSKALTLAESWDGALSDADEVIKLAPSSHRGYELRNAALRGTGRHAEAVEAFNVMLSKLEGPGAPPHHSQCKSRNDILGKQYCTTPIDSSVTRHIGVLTRRNSEQLENAEMNPGNYNEAAEYFSATPSRSPADPVDILIERSKALALVESWDEALSDADKVIKLAPSSYRGYELRNAALRGMNRHAEAVKAFGMMLSKLEGLEAPSHRSKCKCQNDILRRQ